jgi:hypothetical protein
MDINKIKAAFRTIMYHNYRVPTNEKPIFMLYTEECLEVEKALDYLEQLLKAKDLTESRENN